MSEFENNFDLDEIQLIIDAMEVNPYNPDSTNKATCVIENLFGLNPRFADKTLMFNPDSTGLHVSDLNGRIVDFEWVR